MIKGINDSEEDAFHVARLLRGIPAKINLIPFNRHPQSTYQRPEDGAIHKFREVLMANRFTTMVRQSKGVDILAACGQLGGRSQRPKK